jgi:hypothetical protein
VTSLRLAFAPTAVRTTATTTTTTAAAAAAAITTTNTTTATTTTTTTTQGHHYDCHHHRRRHHHHPDNCHTPITAPLHSRWHLPPQRPSPPQVQRELSAAQPDVACFQEVQVEVYHRDLAPWLSEHGYDGVLLTGEHRDKWAQHIPRRPDSERVGVATFWRRETFALVAGSEVHRSRTLGVLLHDLRSQPLAQQIAVNGDTSSACGVGGSDGGVGVGGDTSGSSGDSGVGKDGHGADGNGGVGGRCADRAECIGNGCAATTTRVLAVVNVHLRADPAHVYERLRQLQKTLRSLDPTAVSLCDSVV